MRTRYTLINMLVNIGGQFLTMLLSFINRMVFIPCLSAAYLGVNGLFTDVLSILNFAELGIGTAMVFSMYEPAARDDTQKLARLMNLYKWMYRAVAATVLLSVPLGILAAVRHDRFTDYFLRFCSFIGNALPNFFVALLLMQVFSIRWRLLPVLSEGISLRSAVLPTLTLAIAMSAKYMRQVRAAVLEELNRDYVTGARARGVREGVILGGSVLRCAMLTILTLLALSVGSLLGGTAIIESIFQWDGVGKLAVEAITMRDYPMIQAYVVWMAVIYVAVNLVTDLLYHALDPRIRLGVSRE